MKPKLVVEPGEEYVAQSADGVRLVLWRSGTAERYHLYRHDETRRLDELVGVYPSLGSALADARQLQAS